MDAPFFKPILIALVLAVLWVLEHWIPAYADRSNRLRHNAANLALGLLNALVVAALLAGMLQLVAGWSEQQQFGLLRWVDLPDWFEWLLALVLFDGWQYVWHRLNHRWSWLWRFHAVHHTDLDLDASSAVRFHTIEILLSSLLRLAVLPVLGLSMSQLLMYELIALPVIFFHHSNVRVPGALDRMLRWLIVTPSIHRVHHSELKPETDSNYASLFSFWDRLFGTRGLHAASGDIVFGLGERFRYARWCTVDGMLMQPFQNKIYRS